MGHLPPVWRTGALRTCPSRAVLVQPCVACLRDVIRFFHRRIVTLPVLRCAYSLASIWTGQARVFLCSVFRNRIRFSIFRNIAAPGCAVSCSAARVGLSPVFQSSIIGIPLAISVPCPLRSGLLRSAARLSAKRKIVDRFNVRNIKCCPVDAVEPVAHCRRGAVQETIRQAPSG